MARAASKSPARGRRGAPAAAPAAAPADADHTQLGIALAVLGAVWYQSVEGDTSKLNLDGFASATAEGFTFKVPNPLGLAVWTRFLGESCNLVLTLHALNTIQNTAGTGGYWLNNFVQSLVAAFVGVIAPKVLGGKCIVNAIFTDPGATLSVTSFFLLWYVVNYDIPGCPARMNLWDKVSELGGDALTTLLGFGSVMFTTKLVVAAVKPAAFLSGGWFAAVVTGVVVGTAGSFFPLSKGFTLTETGASKNAFAISFFLASNGFVVVDTAINGVLAVASDCTVGVLPADLYKLDLGNTANTVLCGPFGGPTGFVTAVVALNYLLGDLVPVKTQQGFDLFGVMDTVLNLVQL